MVTETNNAHENDPLHSLLKHARQQPVGSVALGELLEYYRPLLERFSSQRVSLSLSAKVTSSEVTQIALFRAAERFGDFRGETTAEFRAWLCVILQNEITDHSRRYLHTQCRSITREGPLPHDLAQPDGQRPSQICSAQEQIAKLLQAVESLTDDLKAIVRMRYQQDMAFTEIAESLGLPVATTRRRWLEAVEQIAHLMA